jgi:hypothetical protein
MSPSATGEEALVFATGDLLSSFLRLGLDLHLQHPGHVGGALLVVPGVMMMPTRIPNPSMAKMAAMNPPWVFLLAKCRTCW